MTAGLRQPRVDGTGPCLGVADGVAGGQADAADHPVGDSRLAAGREDGGLVAAQGEVAEGVPLTVPGQQVTQPLFVVLTEQGATARGTEAGVQDKQEGRGDEDVDEHVDPARRVHGVDAVGERADADAAQQGVGDLVGQCGTGQLVGGGDQQSADRAADEETARPRGEGQLRVGAVPDGRELPAPEEQRGHEQAGDQQGAPVGDVLTVRLLGHGQQVEREQPAYQQQVEDPRGPFTAPHHHGEEECQRCRDEPGGGQVRGEVLTDVVLLDLVTERQRDHRGQIEHGEQPQVPDRGRGRAPAQPCAWARWHVRGGRGPRACAVGGSRARGVRAP